ncbi:hypothetical protein H671_1g0849 [Cricetulus griseus]|nr:hypothetical protein H671_1g0849 [Cricetulus griseus]
MKKAKVIIYILLLKKLKQISTLPKVTQDNFKPTDVPYDTFQCIKLRRGFLKIIHEEQLLAEMVQPHRLFLPGLQISPVLSHYTGSVQGMMHLAFPELDHYLNFLKDPKDYYQPKTRSNIENTTPKFQRRECSLSQEGQEHQQKTHTINYPGLIVAHRD